MLCGLAAPCRSFPRPAADPSRPLHNHSHDGAGFQRGSAVSATAQGENLDVLIGIELVAAQNTSERRPGGQEHIGFYNDIALDFRSTAEG